MPYKILSTGNYALYETEWDSLPSDSTYPNCKLVNNNYIGDGALLEVHNTSTGKITIYAQALEGKWFVR